MNAFPEMLRETPEKSPIERYLELQNGLNNLKGDDKKRSLEEMKGILNGLTGEVDSQIKNLSATPDHSSVIEELAIKDAISQVRKGPIRRFFEKYFGGKNAESKEVDLSHSYLEMRDLVDAAAENPQDVNKILTVAEKIATFSGYDPADKGSVHGLWKGELDKLRAVVIAKSSDHELLKAAVENFIKYSENWMLHLNKSLEETSKEVYQKAA